MVVLVVVSAFFFCFGLAPVTLYGRTIIIPRPSSQSISVQFFQKMQRDLLPSNVTLVAMTPFSALNTQITVAALLALLCTFPFLVYRFIGYISPALYMNEKRALLTVLVPAIGLFAGGVFFAYRVVIPPTLRALYEYTVESGVTAIFSIDDFITFLVTFMFVTGILFLLPIFMVLLSFLGIISPLFWRTQWRYAMFIVLIFSAILTPDGSGVSMLLLSVPLGGLYAAGAGVAAMKKEVKSVSF